MLRFDVSKQDAEIINRIVDRALKLASLWQLNVKKIELQMDITACHANGCELALSRLLHADIGTFGHDVFGIRRHIDRKTGKLQNCFLPRCAALKGEQKNSQKNLTAELDKPNC